MVEKMQYPIKIDLNQFKLHIDVKNKIKLTLHFDSPSRRFYLSLIAFVVNQMKKLGKVTSIPLQEHFELLALLNKTVGSSAGSSEKENLLPRIYMKWKGALPNLEEAPLFRILGMRKEYDEGAGRTYQFPDAEKDSWANLFEYKGSGENVRLKFAIDKIGATLNDVVIIYEDSLNGEAWEKFVSSLKGKHENLPEAEAIQSLSKVPETLLSPMERQKTPRQGVHRWAVLVALIVVIAVAAALAMWKLYLKPVPDKKASMEKMVFPLPDKPSIAVLPFTNISGGKESEYLGDGLAEGIINGLSKSEHIFVIARNSTFTYKGKPVKVKRVAEETGVRYVIEGSLQQEKNRVRITVQLIDALTGRHLFSERYDRDLKDVLTLQDEITMKVLTAVQVKLTGGEDARLRAKGTKNLDAFLKLSQAREHYRIMSKEEQALARLSAEEAIALDSQYSAAYALLAVIPYNETFLGVHKNPREALERALEVGKKAVALDDSSSHAHTALSFLYVALREYEKGLLEAEKAVSLEPNSAWAHHALGSALMFAGRHGEALPILKKSLRLSPIAVNCNVLVFLGNAHRDLGQYEEALATLKKSLQLCGSDHLLGHLALSITYMLIGLEKEARAEASEVMRIDPNFSVERYMKSVPLVDQSRKDRHADALRKAGLK